jgi:DNA-binding MarR family transcriptional regulator
MKVRRWTLTAEDKPIQDSWAELTGGDKLIHEPARLAVLTILNAVESADFLYLLRATTLTKGNLSIHLQKLEGAGLIEIEKTYQGKTPRTLCRMTEDGRRAFEVYKDKLRSVLGD